MHMYSSLWSLLLPVTVHGRVSDIWRGYFAQVRVTPISVQLITQQRFDWFKALVNWCS